MDNFNKAQLAYDNMLPIENDDNEDLQENEIDFESWEEYCRKKEVEQISQNHLDWLYNTK